MDNPDVPFVEWDEFESSFLDAWAPNKGGRAQHVTLVGPNGQGKTMLALRLLRDRGRERDSHIVVFATKPRDKELSALARREPDWSITRTWPPNYGNKRVIFWPKFGDVRSARQRQRRAFEPVIADVFSDGNRIVYIDEVIYFDQLGLSDLLVQLWQMGRSQNVVVVAGTQRPRNVPRAMFSEPSWFIAFRTADEDELRRVSEIGGADTRLIRETMKGLRPHEFLVVQTRTGNMVRSMVKR